jgi:multidrug transporter EmrE-like cation transporter
VGLQRRFDAAHGFNQGKNMRNWLYLAITIFGEVVATSALKSSNGFTKPLPSAIVVVGYGLAFYFLSLALKSIPVGVAYAIWAGVGIVLVATIAWIFHGQKLDGWAIVGIGLIISGVAVLNLLSGSKTQ